MKWPESLAPVSIPSLLDVTVVRMRMRMKEGRRKEKGNVEEMEPFYI